MRAPTSAASLLPGAVTVLLALALASCGGIPQVTVPKEVKVQVPVPCVKPDERPKPPAVVDVESLLAMDEGTRTLRVYVDRKRLGLYAAELEAVVEGCSRIPIVTPAPGAPAH